MDTRTDPFRSHVGREPLSVTRALVGDFGTSPIEMPRNETLPHHEA